MLFSGVSRNFDFKPAHHVNYENRTVSVKDGLPKFKDFPNEFNGTGEILPE